MIYFQITSLFHSVTHTAYHSFKTKRDSAMFHPTILKSQHPHGRRKFQAKRYPSF